MTYNFNWQESELEQDFIDKYKHIFVKHGGPLFEPRHQRHHIRYYYAKLASNLNGDFVECGVYNGESVYIITDFCKTNFHLFDSWEGVSELGEFDGDTYKTYKWIASQEETQELLKDYNNIKYYKGWIPSRFDEVKNIHISFLHLDLDLYEPTKQSLEHLWDKMVPGGIVLSDFHDGFATGAEKATRDFFAGIRDIEVLPTGVAVIIK